MDCEYVGAGVDGHENVLARVSIVNLHLKCVYDKYVRPRKPVTDYRTSVSGIRPELVKNADPFTTVRDEVAAMIKGRVLVGHSINNDLEVLGLSHPRRMVRDTSKYKVFRAAAKTRFPKLKHLASILLGMKIQAGEHDSVEDAIATMKLYVAYRQRWEQSIKNKKMVYPVECVKRSGRRKKKKKK